MPPAADLRGPSPAGVAWLHRLEKAASGSGSFPDPSAARKLSVSKRRTEMDCKEDLRTVVHRRCMAATRV